MGLQIRFGSLPVTESHGLLSQCSYGANKEEVFIVYTYIVAEIFSSGGGLITIHLEDSVAATRLFEKVDSCEL